MTPEERAKAREYAAYCIENCACEDYAAGLSLNKTLDALEAAERERDQLEQSWNDQVRVTTVRIAERDTARARLAEVEQARDWIREESDNRAALLIAARTHVETLVEALRFYADRDNWTYPYSDDMEPGDICEKAALVDSGDRARAALRAAKLDNTSGESK